MISINFLEFLRFRGRTELGSDGESCQRVAALDRDRSHKAAVVSEKITTGLSYITFQPQSYSMHTTIPINIDHTVEVDMYLKFGVSTPNCFAYDSEPGSQAPLALPSLFG